MSQAPRALLVLGMHRSGTSALARLLATLGVDFGTGHLPPSPANELGFYEKAEIADANDRLLRALGLEGANDPQPLPAGWLDTPACRSIRADLIELLRKDFEGSQLFGVKDPRICRLAPLWIEVLQELGSEPAFVHITRHPLEVADSLAQREGLAPRTAQLSWLRHCVEADRASRGHPRVFVRYEELLDDWRGAAERIAETLDLVWPCALETAEPQLPQGLRHHRHDDEEEATGAAARWVRAAYRALLTRRDGTEAGASRRLDELRRNLEAADELSGLEASGSSPSEPRDEDPCYRVRPRWDHGQLDARNTIGEIVAGGAVGFDLEMRHEGFCAFDLLFGTYARTNTSTLEVCLLEERGGERLEIERWTLQASELANDRWRAFRFAPRPGSRQGRYRVELSSPDAEFGDAVTIYADLDGAAAYRAYFAELEAVDSPEAQEPAEPQELADAWSRVDAVADRMTQLEAETSAREARVDGLAGELERLLRDTVPQIVAWSGRVPGMEERIASVELEGARRPELDALSTRLDSLAERLDRDREGYRAELVSLGQRVEAEVARARGEVGAMGERLVSLRTEFGGAQSQASRLASEIAASRADAELAAERLRAELVEQRAGLEPLAEQLRVLRELQTATREAGETGQRELGLRLARAEQELGADLRALREEEEALRAALEASVQSRVSQVDQLVHEDAAARRRVDEELERRLAGLESQLLESAERVEALQRQTDRDLMAIGDALEEAWG